MSTPEDDDALLNRPAFQMKHIIGKTLKWGAIGAVAGGLLLAGVGALMGGAFIAGLPFGIGYLATGATAVSGHLLPAIGSLLGPALTAGLIGGVAVGGGLGAINGISNASEAADDETERLAMRRDKQTLRRQQQETLAMMGAQQNPAAMAPQAGYGYAPQPQGRGMDGRGV